ncbi:MAG: HIT family protein [bacterium]
MDNCIFCKIIMGYIPSYKIYEDDVVCAFLDIMPVSKGHTLVVPKVHYENIFDTPEDVLCKIISVIKKITPAVLKAVEAEGFNLGVNNGTIAGQVVEHIHFHIMPRFNFDRLKLWEGGAYESEEAEEIQARISEEISKIGI